MTRERAFQIGEWTVRPADNRIRRGEDVRDLEPRVMALLTCLAETPGEAVSRETLRERLWPGVVVNDEALARLVWKLRKALDDPAKSPRYIETAPKAGYRLAEAVTEAPTRADASGTRPGRPADLQFIGLVAVILATMAGIWFFTSTPVETAPADDAAVQAGPDDVDALIRRADGFYIQMTERGNEAARSLYEAALRQRPGDPAALAGLANVITQSVVRWGETPGEFEPLSSKIREAIESGRTATPEARARLRRALGLAREAVAADPDAPLAWRALGLAQSASGDFAGAIESYERAVTLDPDAWEALINLGDLHQISGEPDIALAYFERTYEAMSRVYEDQAELVGPWHSRLGVDIAADHIARGQPARAELWYRRVLYWDPLNAEAAQGLAGLLVEAGDPEAARRVCNDAQAECDGLAAPDQSAD